MPCWFWFLGQEPHGRRNLDLDLNSHRRIKRYQKMGSEFCLPGFVCVCVRPKMGIPYTVCQLFKWVRSFCMVFEKYFVYIVSSRCLDGPTTYIDFYDDPHIIPGVDLSDFVPLSSMKLGFFLLFICSVFAPTFMSTQRYEWRFFQSYGSGVTSTHQVPANCMFVNFLVIVSEWWVWCMSCVKQGMDSLHVGYMFLFSNIFLSWDEGYILVYNILV